MREEVGLVVGRHPPQERRHLGRRLRHHQIVAEEPSLLFDDDDRRGNVVNKDQLTSRNKDRCRAGAEGPCAIR